MGTQTKTDWTELLVWTTIAAIKLPFALPYRYVTELANRRKYYDICESCVNKFLIIPFSDLRPWVSSRCKVCASDTGVTFSDVCTGGPDRCQRLTMKEYVEYSLAKENAQ